MSVGYCVVGLGTVLGAGSLGSPLVLPDIDGNACQSAAWSLTAEGVCHRSGSVEQPPQTAHIGLELLRPDAAGSRRMPAAGLYSRRGSPPVRHRDSFLIAGRGLVVEPGFEPQGDERLRADDPILLRRPDGTELRATVGGIEMFGPGPRRRVLPSSSRA